MNLRSVYSIGCDSSQRPDRQLMYVFGSVLGGSQRSYFAK